MPTRRSDASVFLQRMAFALLATMPLIMAAPLRPALAQAAVEVRLFRIMTMREDLVLGLMPAELAALGSGPEVDVLARHIVAAGQLTGWRYVVTRASDGGTQLAARDRVAVLRQDALTVEPYRAALPVLPPPR
ncbi:hypothetical protein ACLF3G_03075 [Falsiroseomonas sp. HC035]|uniref:hypothetical protein n=1 Tax=Falsiroseomonas sp. HC035 TaxID=3390999 RepID=UPI003D31846F